MGRRFLFILLQRFDLDLCIVEPIDAVEVLVKSKIIVQRVKSFPSCNYFPCSNSHQ